MERAREAKNDKPFVKEGDKGETRRNGGVELETSGSRSFDGLLDNLVNFHRGKKRGGWTSEVCHFCH